MIYANMEYIYIHIYIHVNIEKGMEEFILGRSHWIPQRTERGGCGYKGVLFLYKSLNYLTYHTQYIFF